MNSVPTHVSHAKTLVPNARIHGNQEAHRVCDTQSAARTAGPASLPLPHPFRDSSGCPCPRLPCEGVRPPPCDFLPSERSALCLRSSSVTRTWCQSRGRPHAPLAGRSGAAARVHSRDVAAKVLDFRVLTSACPPPPAHEGPKLAAVTANGGRVFPKARISVSLHSISKCRGRDPPVLPLASSVAMGHVVVAYLSVPKFSHLRTGGTIVLTAGLWSA